MQADRFFSDREEVTRESNTSAVADYAGTDDEDDWGGEGTEWTVQDETEDPEDDVNDESAAYLEFLNQEVQTFGAIKSLPLTDQILLGSEIRPNCGGR